MPDDSRAQDPALLASDGDDVKEGVDPPAPEELEAAHAVELVRLAEGGPISAGEAYVVGEGRPECIGDAHGHG